MDVVLALAIIMLGMYIFYEIINFEITSKENDKKYKYFKKAKKAYKNKNKEKMFKYLTKYRKKSKNFSDFVNQQYLFNKYLEIK